MALHGRESLHAWLWFITAAVGHTASLQLIEAGPLIGYQHYPPLTTLISTHPWALAIVVAQAILVVAALVRRAGIIRAHLDTLGVSRGRILLTLVLSGCTAATVSPDVFRYGAELAFAASLQLLALGTLVLMAMAVPSTALPRWEQRLDRWFKRRDNAVPWILAAFATVVAATLNVTAYHRHPHVPDEVVYLYNARYFSEGMLTVPPAPVPDAFEVDLMEYEPTRSYSPMAAAWPAFLSLGVAAGAPWLVNPLLAGANILLAWALLGHLWAPRVARIATALLAVSPWFLFLGMSFMTHQLTLTCVLVAALGVVHARRTGRLRWGLMAGAAVGATSLIRPLDGAIVGALMAAWSVGLGGARLRFAPLAALLAAAVAVGALVLPYNQALTGDPLAVPINAYFDRHYAPNANAYGFGPDRGVGWTIDPNLGHSPIDGVINTNLNVFGLTTELFGWSTGSLIFVAWLVCSGGVRREDWPMLVFIAAFITAYFFYYFSGGPDFGARYWFPIIVPLAVLTARGMEALERSTGARVWFVAAALSVMAMTIYVPWRAMDKYHHFRNMRADLRDLSEQHAFGADLVLVRGVRFPDYASAFAHNPVDLRSAVPIYAWDRNADTRAAVLSAYSDRRVWLVDGPTITGAGYRVAGGPLTAREVMAATLK